MAQVEKVRLAVHAARAARPFRQGARRIGFADRQVAIAEKLRRPTDLRASGFLRAPEAWGAGGPA